MQYQSIHVHSEIGKLKKVLLHRPGRELENLIPDHLERLLFDDIPYLKEAQAEHDAFADLLRDHGAVVVYLEDLIEEALVDEEVKDRFIRDVLAEATLFTSHEQDVMTRYLGSLPRAEMIASIMAGVRKSEVEAALGWLPTAFRRQLERDYPFVLDPMPNLYFTRDPFAVVGDGVTIHRMFSVTRRRETIFAAFIFSHHPLYKNTEIWYDRAEPCSLEGGDLLVLNETTVAMGISQRTQGSSIVKFAEHLLAAENGFQKILAFDIPKRRTFMHLDTVFTMVDRDKFTVHPEILSSLDVFIITRPEAKIQIRLAEGSLADILKEQLNLDQVTLIGCGSNDLIDAAREQWNDGSNTLALAPGKVVVYARNDVTNKILEDAGVDVLALPCSELSRGRGGPRCMSMPLIRSDL